MKTKETLTKQALDWWKSLTLTDKQNKIYHYCTGNEISTMKVEIKDIEEIWKNEVQIVELRNAEHNAEYLEKPNKKQYSQEEVDELLDRQTAETTHKAIKAYKELNKKQFKQFDGILFKSYIDKFSDEDKIKALKTLTNELHDSNLKYYIFKWFSI